MRPYVSTVFLLLACAGRAGQQQVSISLPDPNATLIANAVPTATCPSQARGNQVSGGNGVTQAMQTRGQFELVGSQGRVVNPQGVFSSGFVRIPVLARNRSGEWADVVVDVELLDANGQALVDRAATNAGEPLRSPYTILPGGTMCYLYLRDVERLNGDYASHRLTLSQA